MQQRELFFVIPTYRLREVGETIEQYDDHFWRNGHSVPMVVFDGNPLLFPSRRWRGRPRITSDIFVLQSTKYTSYLKQILAACAKELPSLRSMLEY